MEKILFVCETKAQVFNAIVLKQSLYKSNDADICLCNKTGILDSIIVSLKNNKIFNTVYTFKMPYRPKQDFVSFAIKAFEGFSILKRVGNVLKDLPFTYNKVFISGPDLACISIYYLIKKKNKNIQLCLYEEGIFEYYIFTYKFNKVKRLYSKMIYGSYYLDDCDEIYVYNPKAIVGKPDSVKSVKIPNQFDRHFIEIANKTFQYNDNDLALLHNCKFLFVESCFDEQLGASVQYKLIKKLYEKVGNSLIVKLHPRSDTTKYDSIGVKCLTTKQSMEMIILNNKLEGVTFFSMYSSAIFNLKFMFNITPNIIMLNEVYNILNRDQGILSLIQKFKDCYPTKKLFIPKGVDEFYECIDNIKQI